MNNDTAIFKRKVGDEEYGIIVNVLNTTKVITLYAPIQNSRWTNLIDDSA